MEFVDGVNFQQGSKKSRSAFANQSAKAIVISQNGQESFQRNGLSLKNPEIGLPGQFGPDTRGHAFGGKNQRRSWRIEKWLSLRIDAAAIAGDDWTGFRRLSASQPLTLKLRYGEPHGHVISLDGGSPDEEGVSPGPNLDQPALVLRAGKSSGRTIAGGDFAICGEGKIGGDAWTKHGKKV